MVLSSNRCGRSQMDDLEIVAPSVIDLCGIYSGIRGEYCDTGILAVGGGSGSQHQRENSHQAALDSNGPRGC